jgi:spore maturation protein A
MVNKIWTYFLIIGIIFSFFSGNSISISDTILNSSAESLNVFIRLFPVITLWLGIMNIATESGLLAKLSKLLSKVLHPIFPDIPKNHESLGYISSNIVANMFGLGSAATPFGLKAMNSLQKLNKDKSIASKSMLTFTALNTSAITIYPTTLVALRIMHNSLSPSKTVCITIISTIVSTFFSLILDKILSRRF